MTKRFPKTITVKPKTDSEKFFFGVGSFHTNTYNLLLEGLKQKDIFDLLEGKINCEIMNTHYHYYCTNGHSTVFKFMNQQVEGTVEVKHWGKTWEGGQIEHVVITITKCEVPKVVFT